MSNRPGDAEPHVPSGGGPGATKVAIIEDRREIREGLQLLINGTDSYRCTGTYRSMEDALSGIGSDLPDVALVDIGLPGMSGIEGIALIRGKPDKGGRVSARNIRRARGRRCSAD